jgi:hypothetical protein
MKTVIFSHGDKGGVGKSTIAAVMVDRIVDRAGSCTIIDGDVKTSDLHNRYSGTKGVDAHVMQINYAGAASVAMNQLSELVEGSDSEFVVINCPAAAGDTLDELAGLFREVCTMLDIRMAATYALGTKDECAGALAQSLKNGLMSFVDENDRMVLYPIFQGDKAAFPWEKDPARASYMGKEGVFPSLEPKFVMQALEKTTGHLSDAIHRKDIGLTLYARVSIRHWLNDARNVLDPLLFPDDMEQPVAEQPEDDSHDEA